PVRELVVGDYVIELSGRLIVPRASGLSAVNSDRRALVGGYEHDVRIVRVDPYPVVIVSSRGSLDRSESLTTIGRAVSGCVCRVHHIRIARIDFYFREIRGPSPDTHFIVGATPCLARIVGAVNAAEGRSIDRRVHPAWIAR